MKAILQKAYGSPEVLELEEMEQPIPKEDEVLVRVQAAGLHAGDVLCMRGQPFPVRFALGLRKPKAYVPGYDVAGRVEAVGQKVSRFKAGDEVFGSCVGSCAEFVCTTEDKLVPKPAELTFEQAAAIPTSALAALHGLRDAGKVQPGHKVLINGASGGVGLYAVQIAKALGAEVTGVCSTKNVDMLRSIGADHVIDYTTEDFTQAGPLYDLILDNVASRSLSDCRRALKPQGVHIPNSGHAGLGFVFKAFFQSLFLRKQGRPYLSVPKQADLLHLSELAESGKLTPKIDRTYELSQVPEALGYVGEGHVSGKVVVSLPTGPR